MGIEAPVKDEWEDETKVSSMAMFIVVPVVGLTFHSHKYNETSHSKASQFSFIHSQSI